ncbi:hypothetical protein MOK15_02215 [Sphingobium sp. BYY-5]|uniref:hypothetical protein n=1 Tax=Sphingobium sp. BYY-5 TaxID=2926400 RepID=UPI001FA7A9F8|nr:hypothetical protein [Sphingobium sp. BYY-5]MCI4588924.1 hypothetical protein [Sphingobium sp. BYY-5]
MERDWGFVRPFLFGFAVASWIILLSGCSLVTLPVKATSKAVDWSTTSRNEADRNRGREMRKQDEAYARCMRERAGNC